MKARPALDAAIGGAARLILGVFFREIEVMGAERIPAGGPVLVVANHVNNLIDPLLLLGFTGLRPRILAKSTLWRHPVAGPLVLLCGALPVYRHRDAGADVSRNFDTFARCYEVLGAGGAVMLFPEGTSHNEPHGLPLKTGAARIALEALDRRPRAGLRILPVGLTYEAKQRFRSRVLITVGEPIDPTLEWTGYSARPGAAVRRLTARIRAGLDAITVSHGSWEEARLIRQAFALYSDRPPDALSQTVHGWKAFQSGYQQMRSVDSERVTRLAAGVARYGQRLEALAVTDGDVVGRAAPPTLRGQGWARTGRRSVALWGSALHWFPYRLVGWLVACSPRTPDEPATYAVLAALLVFPTWWAGLALAAGWAGGWLGSAAALVAAPVSAWMALRLHEQRGRFRRPGRPVPGAFRRLGALRRRRAQLCREVGDLVEEYKRRDGPR